MAVPRWQIKLRRRGRAGRHYAQTIKVERSPSSGDQVVVRDIDGARITAIVRSFENCSRPKSRFETYIVEADELDGGAE
jgi:hypothetical protein